MRRISWFIGLMAGVLLIAGAGVVRWVVAPAVTVLPGDTDTIRVYQGTAISVINPTALSGTLYGPAMLHNVPATIQHHTKVLATNGDNALVADRKTVTVPGHTVADVTDRYAVDRKSMAAGTGFSNVTKQTGLTFNWPIHTQKHDYTGWVSDTQSTTTLKYAGEAKRGGITTYVFKADVPATRITDPQTLRGLPAAMPKSLLTAMVPSLGLTTAQLAQLGQLLPKLPDPAPFGYMFSGTSTYWIAPDSGIVVDLQSRETRTSAFVVGGAVVPVGPVLDLTFTSPASTLKGAAADAKDSAEKMTLISSTVPLVMLVVGGVLVVTLLTAAVIRRRRPPAAAPATPAPPRQLTPTG